MEKEELIHVYCMPGLAANPSIFENIRLPEEKFRIHWIDWILPKPGEELKDYSRRICERVRHQNPVLIGVSFGGIIVQEMSKFIKTRRVIIISSVKSASELPRRMKFARCTRFYKVLPTSLARHVDLLESVAMGKFIRNRARLYKRYMSVTDTRYLDWAIEKMICWKQKSPHAEVVHIHGDQDEILPFRYIKGCIPVPGGTHIMILNRFRWFNENLEDIILTGELKREETNRI